MIKYTTEGEDSYEYPARLDNEKFCTEMSWSTLLQMHSGLKLWTMFLMVPCSFDSSDGGIANGMGHLCSRVYLGTSQSSCLHCHLQGQIAMCISN